MAQEQRPVYRPASGLVTALTFLFLAFAGLATIGAGADWLGILALRDAAAGQPAGDDPFTAGLLQGLLRVGQLALFITLVWLCCTWIQHANRNARALGAAGMRFTPQCCVSCFFIPVVCLFSPYLAVQEIWRASHPEADARSWRRTDRSPMISAWWAAWIIATIAVQAAIVFTLLAESSRARLGAAWMTLLADVLLVPLSILALRVVSEIHVRQERRFLHRPSRERRRSRATEPARAA